MDRSTPKIRFGISPGSSARIAEQEQKTAEAGPQMQIRGGTAARMSEGEAPAAAQRPYSISMQARTGKPFTLADVSGMDHRSQAEMRESESEQRPRDGAIQTSPFRPIPERNKFSTQTGNVPIFGEGVLAARDEERSQTSPRSLFQKLRSPFSRTLPKQEKKQ
jgi:hypothetical protein